MSLTLQNVSKTVPVTLQVFSSEKLSSIVLVEPNTSKVVAGPVTSITALYAGQTWPLTSLWSSKQGQVLFSNDKTHLLDVNVVGNVMTLNAMPVDDAVIKLVNNTGGTAGINVVNPTGGPVAAKLSTAVFPLKGQNLAQQWEMLLPWPYGNGPVPTFSYGSLTLLPPTGFWNDVVINFQGLTIMVSGGLPSGDTLGYGGDYIMRK